MRCDELQPDYLMYAIGTMKEPEYGEMRAHLERGCETCTTGLREARELAYSMGAAVDGPSPPRRLRGRVLAVTAADDRRVARPGWRLILLPAACLVLTLAFGFFWYRQASKWSIRQAETEARLRQEERSTAVLRERLAGLESAPPRAVPIFSLELVRGGADAGEPLKQLAISPGAPEVVLAVPNDLFRQASVAELRNASEQVVWSSGLPAAGDADSAGLSIPGRLLPAGRYVLLLRASERTIARLLFQVTAGK